MSVPSAFRPLWYSIRTVPKCEVSTAAPFDPYILSAQESVGVSPRDHIEGLKHMREAFMRASLSDGERSAQTTSSLPGVLRGALGWIDLPRRRTLDPKVHVGEQACYGGGTSEKESRGVPRSALDWIDLPRRRTFDPNLHVGEQACYGEDTNENEIRSAPRGALGWIDLPRRRVFDPELHVGEQASYGESTYNEMESRGAPRGSLNWNDLPRRRTFDLKLHVVGGEACYGEGTNAIESRGVHRGALDWIDLPRRRTFDPNLHVGEQACYGEGANENETRGAPRGALPRRRTFDPMLHMGKQACVGEGTNEIESRGVSRGALGWIDLPRRRIFDPKLHVGEQACFGEGPNKIETRSAPRGVLGWIDLPRRRTFDPKLHVGKQACYGETTNEVKIRSTPRGALDWIDLPRRRTFDSKIHIGEQACVGEGTNEIESRESIGEHAYAKMPRSIRRQWSVGSVSETRVDDNPRRKKGFQLELGGGHEQGDARRVGFVSPRETKYIPAISLGRQQANTAPEDDSLPVKELIIGPHVEKIQQLSETEPSTKNRVWSSKAIRKVLNTTAPVPVDIPRRSSVSCRVDGNTKSIQKQVHRSGDIDQDRPPCGSESLNVHLDNRPVVHDVPQQFPFPLSQHPTPLSENMVGGTDIDLGAIPTPKEENCQFETKSELGKPLDRDTSAMGGVHGFRWRRSSTTPVAMDLPRPFAANPVDIRGLWSDNDGDTLVKSGGDHENAMNTLQPEVWSVNAQRNGVCWSSSDVSRHRLVNQFNKSGTSRIVGTGVDSGAFVAVDIYNPIAPTSRDELEEYQPSGNAATKAQKRKPRLTHLFESKVPSVLDLPRRKDSYDLSNEKTPLACAKEEEHDTTNTQGTQDRVHTEAVKCLAFGNASSTRSTSGLTPGMVKKTTGGRYTRLPTIFENEALC